MQWRHIKLTTWSVTTHQADNVTGDDTLSWQRDQWRHIKLTTWPVMTHQANNITCDDTSNWLRDERRHNKLTAWSGTTHQTDYVTCWHIGWQGDQWTTHQADYVTSYNTPSWLRDQWRQSSWLRDQWTTHQADCVVGIQPCMKQRHRCELHYAGTCSRLGSLRICFMDTRIEPLAPTPLLPAPLSPTHVLLSCRPLHGMFPVPPNRIIIDLPILHVSLCFQSHQTAYRSTHPSYCPILGFFQSHQTAYGSTHAS